MMDLTTFHECLAQPTARGYDLDHKQKQAVEYDGSPLWLLAGPGSGKSEVLVTRTLKLLCVDGVKPLSIHQSKGLEFPLVFLVTKLGQEGKVGAAQMLEQTLALFRQTLYPTMARQPKELAVEDDIRLLYVAYSRAQYGLILVGTKDQMKNHVAVPGRDVEAFRRNTVALTI